MVGAGMAGLFTARVLADHCAEVLVVERDDADPAQGTRRGVPQGGQVHVLMTGSLQHLERRYPGIIAEAQQAGAVLAEPDMLEGYRDGVPVAGAAGTRMLGATRPLLESLVRRRTESLANVHFRSGRVHGLVAKQGRVTGVAVDLPDGTGTSLDADLVVDATGRGSRAARWLTDAGFQAPETERVPAGVSYASALFERDEANPAIAGALAGFSPGAGPGGVAIGSATAVEDGRWMIMLVGHDGDRPGRTEQEFRDSGQRMPGLFAHGTRGALAAPIATYHVEDNLRRRYDRLSAPPAGFLAVGDTVASFNPTFGQGIVSAGLQVVALDRWLAAGSDDPAGFFAEQKVAVDAAWAVAAGSDTARLSPPQGGTTTERLGRWIDGRVRAASLTDPVVADRVAAVGQLRSHPTSLRRPTLIGRVLLTGLATTIRTRVQKPSAGA